MRTAPENEAKIVKGNKCPHNCHTTTRRQKRGECCREGKSVRKCDFCNVCGVLVLLLLLFFNDKAFENQWSYSPHSPPPPPRPSTLAPFPICWVSSLEAGFSKEGQTAKGDKWLPSRRKAVPLSGQGEPPPAPAPSQACLILQSRNTGAFKSHFLSIH